MGNTGPSCFIPFIASLLRPHAPSASALRNPGAKPKAAPKTKGRGRERKAPPKAEEPAVKRAKR